MNPSLCAACSAALVWWAAAAPPAAATGVPGLAVLRLGPGARAAALAEATTALTDGEAAGANPAALASGRGLALSHTEWLAGTRHERATLHCAVGDSGAVALDLLLAHAGGLERRVGPSLEPLGQFGVYEWTAGAAWSRPAGRRLRLGLGLKYLRQSIYTEAASGAAADLGLLYAGRSWSLGAALRNAGAMDDLDRRSTRLPRQVRLGAAAARGPFLATVDGEWTAGLDPGLRAGVEWRVARSLVLRGGGQTASARRPSAGAGVLAGPWRVDYAFIPFAGGLDTAHRLSLVWAGG